MGLDRRPLETEPLKAVLGRPKEKLASSAERLKEGTASEWQVSWPSWTLICVWPSVCRVGKKLALAKLMTKVGQYLADSSTWPGLSEMDYRPALHLCSLVSLDSGRLGERGMERVKPGRQATCALQGAKVVPLCKLNAVEQ